MSENLGSLRHFNFRTTAVNDESLFLLFFFYFILQRNQCFDSFTALQDYYELGQRSPPVIHKQKFASSYIYSTNMA